MNAKRAKSREQALLEESVRLAKNGERPAAPEPADCPEGARIDRKGDWVLPAGAPARADLLYRTTEMRLALGRRVKRLEELESALEAYFVETLPQSDSTGVAGLAARVQILPNYVPTVRDWDALYAYVKKNNAFDLLQRRLSKEAVRERLDARKQVPGVEMFNAKRVSCVRI